MADHMESMSDREIGEILGRSTKSVYTKRRRIHRDKKPTAWTAQDDAMLIELSQTMCTRQLIAQFGRSQHDIILRGSILGIQLRPSGPSICFDCAKALGGCSWADSFDPVDGWVAVPTMLGKDLESYRVFECPLFEPG